MFQTTVYSSIHAFKNLCDFKQLVYIFFHAVVNLCDLQLHVHMIHEHVIQNLVLVLVEVQRLIREQVKIGCQRIVWLPSEVECLPQIDEVLHCGWSHSLVVSGVDIYSKTCMNNVAT